MWEVHINGGRVPTGLEAVPWAREVERLGAGEIVLTSMDCDGTKDGYDLEITAAVSEAVSIPVVASGGAGKPEHLADAITIGKADAALAASIFHFGEYTIEETKRVMAERGIAVRLGNVERNSTSLADVHGRAVPTLGSFVHGQSIRTKHSRAASSTSKAGAGDRQAVSRLREACKASDLHLKVDKPPIVRVERHAAAHESRADHRRGNGPAHVSADERAESQDLRQGRRGRLRPHARRRRHRSGGSASTCCSSWATSAWWLGASTT